MLLEMENLHLLDVNRAETSIDACVCVCCAFLAFSEKLTCDKTFAPNGMNSKIIYIVGTEMEQAVTFTLSSV